jgi:hypothetical protein
MGLEGDDPLFFLFSLSEPIASGYNRYVSGKNGRQGGNTGCTLFPIFPTALDIDF